MCAPEHHGDDNGNCLGCQCNPEGSVDNDCDGSGKCTCRPQVMGDKCDDISPGYYDLDDPKGKHL